MAGLRTMTDEQTTTITIDGDFDLSLMEEYRRAYEQAPPKHSFIVDLAKSPRIATAGLGMLLVMRDFLGGDGSRITIANSRGKVREILELAKFNTLFHMPPDFGQGPSHQQSSRTALRRPER